jgi:hypothetical protein
MKKNAPLPLIIVESPLAGHPHGPVKGLEFARACCADVARNYGCSVFASHLFYTQFLDDTNPTERVLGINLGLALAARADIIRYYTNFGISGGMQLSITTAAKWGKVIEFAELEGKIWDDYLDGAYANFLYKPPPSNG